ncbi:COG1361 S-layer family protein [Candidatus Pyrohabitans sp.]
MRLAILICWMLLIPVAFADNVDFYVMEVSPMQVSPGETTTLNITIANLGTDYAAYVHATIDPESKSPLGVLGAKKVYVTKRAIEGQPTMYFGAILQHERFTFSYPVYVDKNAAFGTYAVPIVLTWRDARGELNTQTLEFGLKVVGKPEIMISGINKTPARIYPDTDFTLIMSFENIGTAKAENVKVELALPQGITGESMAFLGTLDRGSRATATFSLKAGKKAETGENRIGVSISYTSEADAQEQLSRDVEVFVSEKEPANLEIAGLDTSPTRPVPGQAFTLSVQLENIGTQDAKAVKVEISPPAEFSGSLTSYLGTIKQDDTSTAIFDLEAGREAKPGRYLLPVKIYYLDEKGELREEEKQIEVVLTSPERRFSPKLLAGIAVLLLVGIALWRRRRGTQL